MLSQIYHETPSRQLRRNREEDQIDALKMEITKWDDVMENIGYQQNLYYKRSQTPQL